MPDRPLYRNTWKELTKENRMVFMEGARRVGKTTLGEMIAESFANHEYLSWEIPEHRCAPDPRTGLFRSGRAPERIDTVHHVR